MSTLKTHNLQSPDAGSVNIAMTPNAGMVVSGISTFTGAIDANGDLDVDGHTEIDNINISGVSTHVGLSQFQNTINLTHASAGQNYIYFTEDLQFAKNGTGTRLKIDSSGRLLVGRTSGSFAIDVQTGSDSTFRISNSGESGHGSHDAKIVAGGSYYQNPNIVGSTIKFSTYNGSAEGERLRITSGGNIEVATTTTTSPAYLKFNSNRSNADDALGGVTGVWNGNSVAAINFKTGADTTNKDDGELQFVTYSGGSPYERLRIATDGNVHINMTDNGTASAKLNIEDSSSAGTNLLLISNKPSGANGKARMVFHTETSTGQGCSPYIQSVSGADAGPNANNNQNAGGFEFHTRSGGAGTDNNALRIRDDGSFEKYGANGNILLTNTGSDIEFSRGGRNRFSATHSNGYFDFHTGGQYTFPAMRLFASPSASSGAKVGINTDSIGVDAQMSVMAPAGMPGLYTSYGMRVMSHPDASNRISNASGIYCFSASIPANNTWTTVAIGRYHGATVTMRVGDASSKRVMVINYDLTQPAYGVATYNIIANNGNWNTGSSDFQISGAGSDYALQVRHNSYYNTNNTSGVYMNFNVC